MVTNGDDDDELVVPISAIEHYSYCPRQCALIHVDGVWVDNEHTVRGVAGHQRVDDPGASRIERGRLVLRAVPLWSESLNLTGRADVVEVAKDGSLLPVEYKMGWPHGDAAFLQVGAQALCLEEMTGTTVTAGAVWFSGPRRRFRVPIDAALRERVIRLIAEIRAMWSETRLPRAPNDRRCEQCQLQAHCLPDIVSEPQRVLTYLKDLLGCESSLPPT